MPPAHVRERQREAVALRAEEPKKPDPQIHNVSPNRVSVVEKRVRSWKDTNDKPSVTWVACFWFLGEGVRAELFQIDYLFA